MTKKEPIKSQLRIPADLHARLIAATEKSGRSMNAEIVQRLQVSIDSEDEGFDIMMRSDGLNSLLEAKEQSGMLRAIQETYEQQQRVLKEVVEQLDQRNAVLHDVNKYLEQDRAIMEAAKKMFAVDPAVIAEAAKHRRSKP